MSASGKPPSTDAFHYEVSPALRRMWWAFLVVGIAWIAVSLILFRFNVGSVAAVGTLVGVVFIAWGAQELGVMGTLWSDQAGMSAWRWLHGVLGVLFITGGIVAIANPINTFVSMAAIIGWVLFINGIFDIVLALSNRDVDLWWTRLVLGIITLLLAVSVSGSFVEKAVFLVVFVAVGTLVRGVGNIALAFQLRSMKHTVDS